MSDQEEQKPSKKSIPDLRATSNVVPLPAPKKQEKGPKAKDIHHSIVQAMCGKTHGWPPFPAILHKVTDEGGEPIVYQEKDGIVRILTAPGIEALIAHYWQVVLPEGPRPISLGAMSADDARKIRLLWLITAPTRSGKFPMVVWLSDPRPAHHRLPFDPLPVESLKDACPLFDELMARTSNANGLMAFIGSLLDDRSQRQQYVWMYGEGGNGKGALMRALTDVLGRITASEQVPRPDDRFWTSGLLGKRLVYFPDCNNASFVTSGLFKSLSGEDQVRVEIKRGAILSVAMPVKFIFVSNKRPNLSSQKSDMRRVIYCHVGAVGEHVDGYEERLRAEVPALLSACWWLYITLTGANPRALYPVQNLEEVKELAADAEHEYEAFVSNFLTLTEQDASHFIDPDRLSDKEYMATKKFAACDAVRASHMLHQMQNAGFKTEFDRAKLRDYMRRKHRVFCREIKKDGKPYLCYLNCTADWQQKLREDG